MQNKEIGVMSGHYLICGFGRLGQKLCAELNKCGKQTVVIERDKSAASLAEEKGYPCIIGDAKDPDTFNRARIREAAGLVAAVGSDEDNAAVIAAARNLNATMPVVADAKSARSAEALRKAGATSVISTYALAASRMVSLVTNRVFAGFMDSAALSEAFEMVEILVRTGGKLVGKSLQEMRFRDSAGALVVSVTRGDGQRTFSPVGQTILAANDRLLCIGEHGLTDRLCRLIGDEVMILT
jgi:voltage-gated potassium channel